jgi:hypothetical protein
MEHLQWSLGFRHGFNVDGKGKGRGLAMWWRDGIEVSVLPWCQYYVDAETKKEAGSWRLTGLYGEPRSELRDKTWGVLRYLCSQDNLPWI